MISVIIPARNAAATIGATLSSLVSDKALICEILLIDDGSDDATASKASETARRHALPLKVTRVEFANAGAARNAALAKVRGDHVFYLDADDEVIPGGLTLLHEALRANPKAGLAVGSSIHRASKADKLKVPAGYGGDRNENARKYLFDELRSITIGSALVAKDATSDIKFPETIGLDEDTLYWAAVLTRVRVTTIEQPVLFYNIDEARMVRRFVSNPRKVFLDIALEVNRLAAFGIDKPTRQRRKAFIALRIARQLIRRERYDEAEGIMRAVHAWPTFRSSVKMLHYRMRIGAGRVGQSFDHRKAAGRRGASADRTEPSRTLILTADPAFPPVSGADLRNYQNAQAAARFGDVLLVSLQPVGGQPPDDRIRTAALSKKDGPTERSVKRWRTSVETRISRSAIARLKRLMQEFGPDTVIVEGIPLVAFLEHLRPLSPLLILDMHNIESDLAAQLHRAWSLPKRLLPSAWSDQGRIQRLERQALILVDRTWVCSDVDRERLHSLFAPQIPVDVVPNGIPRFDETPSSLAPLPGKEEGWPVMLFVGHLGYEPNISAAERLALKILPKVRQTLPSARVILAGRSPAPSLQELAKLPGVELASNPDDLSALFRRSHLGVMPLSTGGGTRIKILEAMAWGLPVIATTIAAEGQGFTDGEEIAISDTDEELAGLIAALCSDPVRMERQRSIAREKASLRFGPSVVEGAVRKGFGLFDADDV